jgi:hypothetical protein
MLFIPDLQRLSAVACLKDHAEAPRLLIDSYDYHNSVSYFWQPEFIFQLKKALPKVSLSRIKPDLPMQVGLDSSAGRQCAILAQRFNQDRLQGLAAPIDSGLHCCGRTLDDLADLLVGEPLEIPKDDDRPQRVG